LGRRALSMKQMVASSYNRAFEKIVAFLHAY
jgi:hypothetical protein